MRVAIVGAAPSFAAQDFQAREFDYVIAVDGGFAHLKEIDFDPDLVVGDFDSLGYEPKHRRISRFSTQKDFTDLEYALKRAQQKRATELHLYGALGGRLDHSLANLQLAAAFAEMGPYVWLHTETEDVRVLVGPDVLELEGPAGKRVSVLCMSPQATGVFESGLVYSLDDAVLNCKEARGISNELTDTTARIGVESGTLLVFKELERSTQS